MARFVRLRTFHPYLDPLTNLIEDHAKSPSRPSDLLLSLAFYLSSLSFPNDLTFVRIRSSLAPHITRLRDWVLLHLPQDFAAIQALDLMSMHAPLGVLPLQTTNLNLLTVGRGLSAAALSISQVLSFHGLISRMMRIGLTVCWETTDCWLWLSLCLAEAALSLEDQLPRPPSSLAEARGLADTFLAREDLEFWRRGLLNGEMDGLVGRLSLCDRLVRFGHVHDTMASMRAALERAAADSSFDPVEAIVAEFKFFTQRLELLDERHADVMRTFT